MKRLRLFGIKQNQSATKVRINDMEYLSKIGSIKLDIPLNKKWYEVAKEHLEKCGFTILGQVNIMKYDRAYICEENPNSLVAITNELKEKGEI